MTFFLSSQKPSDPGFREAAVEILAECACVEKISPRPPLLQDPVIGSGAAIACEEIVASNNSLLLADKSSGIRDEFPAFVDRLAAYNLSWRPLAAGDPFDPPPVEVL